VHTVPDGQNGFDNGGICGVCKWHKNPAHVETVLTVLEQLASRYRARTALWGIEVLNESISQQLWDAIDLPNRYPPRDPEYARGTGDENLGGYLGHIRDNFSRTVREMSPQFPLIIGEWRLDPMSPVATALTPEQRRGFYRSLADAQLAAWDGAAGWFFWNYKLLINGSHLDGWDLGKSLDLGYLPENLGPEVTPASPGAEGRGPR
jgi:aryl-phospho-beta-D-glucosidase BglC (GH1 family)